MTDTQRAEGAELRQIIERIERLNEEKQDFDAAWPHAHNFEHHHALQASLGDLNAAKTLHEAVLPGWVVRHTWGGPLTKLPTAAPIPYTHTFRPRMTEEDDPFGVSSSGYKGKCPARSWLMAILNALIGMEDEADDR